jgi:hypothetical protein
MMNYNFTKTILLRADGMIAAATIVARAGALH